MRDPHWRTMELLLADYAAGAEARSREWLWWKADNQPFEAAVRRAALSIREDGRRHPHQNRIPSAVLQACAKALTGHLPALESSPRFYELLTQIEALYRPIRGAGELLAYDTADRLRHRLGLASEHLIYLHAGTRVGARRLYGGRLPRGDAWALMRYQIPAPLQILDNHELEDFLCLYKDELMLPPEVLEAQQGRGLRGICGPAERQPARC